jgi:3-oxoacyl-[acyl-carrier protein] reductase
VSDRAFADLTGRKAMVTGSSTGIGRAIAVEFARAGADVVVHGRRSPESVATVASEIAALGRESRLLMADLADADGLSAFAEKAWTAFGGVDVWVNNAGVDLLVGEESKLGYEDKLDRLLDVDVRSAVLLARDIGKRMAEAGSGVILNIGWDQADRGMEGSSGELFALSKNAVMGFTRSLAVSLAPAVRVNCIAPGWIQTAWGKTAGRYWQERVESETPLRRWGTPQDVAAVARFLASDDASYVTGQVIRVNGGAVR